MSSRGAIAERVLDLLGATVVAADRGGSILYANRSACDLFGTEAAPEALVGEPLAWHFRCDPPLPLDAAEPEVEERRFATTLRRADGQPVALGLTFRTLHGEGPLHRLIVCRALPGIHSQMVEEILGTHSGALASLAGEFIHRLRNPLTAIRGLADLLALESGRSAAASEYAGRLRGAAERIERFIRDFARLAWIEAPNRAPVAIQGLIDMALARTLDRDPRAKDVFVRTCDAAIELHCDACQIADGLSELLLNALEAGGPAHEVGVIVSLDTAAARSTALRRVVIEVVDRGAGLPQSDVRQIFEPFFSTKAERSGLGLAIAFGYLSRHGGHLALEAREGGGTQARVDLAEGRA